jgi:DNA-directed RNA polymerase specialized sigma24 family protein
MSRPLTEIDVMALMAKHGLASEALCNKLAAETLQSARIVACIAVRRGLVPWGDIDDITQATGEKAWRYLKSWNSTKSSWLTYVSRITKSVIGDYGRNLCRRQEAENLYYENYKGEPEDE